MPCPPSLHSRALSLCMPLVRCRPPMSYRTRAHTSLRIVRPPFDSAGRGGVQPAAKLRHIQRHAHALDVPGALRASPGPQLSVGLFPFMLLAPRRRPTPLPPPARIWPCIVCPRFDSAASDSLQPAAEPRHVQGHRHALHVLGAHRTCPLPPAFSRPPPMHAACVPAASGPPRLPARISPRIGALCPLSTRQDAVAFNQPLSLDTSSVTDMNFMFFVRSAYGPTALRPNLHSGLLLHATCAAVRRSTRPPGPHTPRPAWHVPSFRLGRQRTRSTSR